LTVPVEDEPSAINPLLSATCPPWLIVTVPIPPETSPTERSPLIVHAEPIPCTVTVAIPLDAPRVALPLETTPPPVILKIPFPPASLILSDAVFVHVEPAPLTVTVPLLAGS